MTEPGKQLTLIEAACLVAGIGVGGAIMAVPYLASLNGAGPLLALLAVAYGASAVLHLMIVEIVSRDGRGRQLVELFDTYVFRGPAGKALTWAFFALLVAGLTTNLAAYIAGGGDLIGSVSGLPPRAGHFAMYALAAGVVFFGLKTIGMSETAGVAGIGAVLVALLVAALARGPAPVPLFTGGGPARALALYGMVMFSFACFWAVPQSVQGLSHNPRLIPRAVLLGIGINLVFVLALSVTAMMASPRVEPVALQGIGCALGPWARWLGSVFGLLAMLTSYWSVSYAMTVILQERLGWSYRPAWICATLPSLVLAVTGVSGFLGFLEITAGALGVMLAVLVAPTLRACRREKPLAPGGFSLGRLGGPAFQILVVVAYILMAIGAMWPAGK